MSGSVDRALARRLEALAGEDASCCAADYEGEVAKARARPAFAKALAAAKAMGDENRLAALALLKRRREMCACELQAALGLTHGTVSHHMRILAEAGLVQLERRGKWVYYALDDSARGVVP